jgi:hypothetical protein
MFFYTNQKADFYYMKARHISNNSEKEEPYTAEHSVFVASSAVNLSYRKSK